MNITSWTGMASVRSRPGQGCAAAYSALKAGTRKLPFPFLLFALQLGQIFSLFNLGLQYPQATHCQVNFLFISYLNEGNMFDR